MHGRLDQSDHLGNTWQTILPAQVTQPAAGFVVAALGLTLQASAIQVDSGPADTLDHVEFEVRTAPGGGGMLTKALSTAMGLLSGVLGALSLPTGATLYIRARNVGVNLGAGPWGSDVQITT